MGSSNTRNEHKHQMLSFQGMCYIIGAPKYCNSSTLTDLISTAHVATLLGWLHSVPEPDVPISWHSQHAETPTETSASQTASLVASCSKSKPATHYLSPFFLGPWCKPSGPITPTFYILPRPAPYGE